MNKLNSIFLLSLHISSLSSRFLSSGSRALKFLIQISCDFESRFPLILDSDFFLFLDPDFTPKAPDECTAPLQGHPDSLQKKECFNITDG